MKEQDGGGAAAGLLWRTGSALLIPVSAALASVFFLFGVRARVLRRNLRLMNLPQDPLFRWKLGYNAGHSLLELLLPIPSPSPLISTRVRSRLETLRAGPGLLLTAHYHNWELQAAAWNRLGIPLLGAARPLKGAVPRVVLANIRRWRGVSVVSNAVPRRALRHLRAGGCFGLLWDQHAPDSRTPGRFFGVPVSLDPLPFFLLEKVPCPVWFGVKFSGGRVRLILLMTRFDNGWQARLERRYHRVLELLVRRAPARWYGFLHARFKNLGVYPGHRGNRELRIKN